MKSVIADPRTLINCLRIVANDGTTIRFTDYPYPVIASTGGSYQSDNGYQFSGVTQTSEGAGTLVDLEGIISAAGLDVDELKSGKWDGARVYIFATSWTNPIEDEEPIAVGVLGKTALFEARYTAQLMHLIDALNVPTGRDYSALCSWILFDETLDGKTYSYQRSRCQLNIYDYLVIGSITSVVSNGEFVDSTRAEDNDYFSNGSVLFTTGDNVGLASIKIKSHTTGGNFILHDDTFNTMQVGDQYTMIPGCRKRLVEDCAAKYLNAPNFGGFRYVPTTDVISFVGRG